ncbi:hypothetical protein RWE15_10780 [Virgibacillus halophilus]|uniref:Uncharacterized protein n=1 Tax=Tigheibacillus halophilus TaxID=361280 RepID=A0ABU5C698_9BACI|nr:hypothetical protein [Virgibacillus halophilus]
MSQIEIIGLGAGDIDQLPLGIYKKIAPCKRGGLGANIGPSSNYGTGKRRHNIFLI